MTFSSITFLCFFSLIIGLMWLLRLPVFDRFGDKVNTFQKIILLIASYIFYGWWDWRFCFLMLALTLIAHITSWMISENKAVKFSLFVGVAVPLIALGIFKYFNFFVDSFAALFDISDYRTLQIILPVGISFYTFQSLSYTIDIYRKQVDRCISFIDVALYIAFFPQLVAGPIVKASDFIPQLSEKKHITLKNMADGLQIFLIGLFKKIVIADNLSVFVDEVFAKPAVFNSLTVIASVVAYSIQIYFDFAGYSDMAIGCAKCLGYDLKKNFNLPYISKNVSEFWKRWHISLSTWLMEYLYIPLGGNRKGNVRTYVNLLITMVLGGLWHGASWNFVLWGVLHGAALCVNKLFIKFKKEHDLENKFGLFGKAVSMLFTYIFVCICWIFFRADNIGTAFAVLKKIFVWDDGVQHIYSWLLPAIAVLVLEIAVSYFAGRKIKGAERYTINSHYIQLDLTKFWSLFFVILFAGLILSLAYTGENPFIYFQF